VAAPDDVLSPEHSARLADLQRQGDALFRASNQFIASIGQVTYIYIYVYIYIYKNIYVYILTHQPGIKIHKPGIEIQPKGPWISIPVLWISIPGWWILIPVS
jgi:hypothetical protein